MNKKLKPYVIFIVGALILIFLFPPVREHRRNNGYSFIFNIENFESIDTTRTFFQCFLTILITYMAYLVNDKIFPSLKLLLNKIYISKKIKITLLLLVVFISIAFLWWKYSENVLDVFLYSKSDFRNFFVDLNIDKKNALNQIKWNSNDENFKAYDSIVNHIAEDDSQLINSLKANKLLSNPIIERYLIDEKYADWYQSNEDKIDLGGLSFALSAIVYNIEFDVPSGKTFKIQSEEKILGEIFLAKYLYYKGSILIVQEVKEDYLFKKTKSEQFVSVARTIKVIGISLLLLIFIASIIFYFRNPKDLKVE